MPPLIVCNEGRPSSLDSSSDGPSFVPIVRTDSNILWQRWHHHVLCTQLSTRSSSIHAETVRLVHMLRILILIGLTLYILCPRFRLWIMVDNLFLTSNHGWWQFCTQLSKKIIIDPCREHNVKDPYPYQPKSINPEPKVVSSNYGWQKYS